MAAAQHLDALHLASAAVISDFKHCFCLNHGSLDSGGSNVNALQRPSFRLGKGSALHDGYRIAHVAIVVFVVCVNLRGLTHELSVDRVLDPTLYLYSDAFFHAITHNNA
jgi:hypothetical protein